MTASPNSSLAASASTYPVGKSWEPNHPVVARLPLPGVVILVHGVNSTGEWYGAAEAGLCEGLNRRLARDRLDCDDGSSLLSPNQYATELDRNGDIIRHEPESFIAAANYSPVIRFRWGYRVHPEKEAREFDSSLWLNEDGAWGGGPFQNASSCLQDLWRQGLSDRLFLGLTAQMINPSRRLIYGCPPRAYYVHAGWRLANLIKTIRDKDPLCPITVLCHSQGNMVTLASAFLGHKMGAQYVADTYILANPPYSTQSLGVYNYSNRRVLNSVSEERRVATLANFSAFVRDRGAQARTALPIAKINERIKNERSGQVRFCLGEVQDTAANIDRDNRGKVFLYCNPHDTVIGASPIQGIGWLGVNETQLKSIDKVAFDGFAASTFHVRVWAQGWPVGSAEPAHSRYHYWDNHWNRANMKAKTQFWFPESPKIRYRLTTRPDESAVAKFLDFLTAPLYVVALGAAGNFVHVNDPPPDNHAVPVNAPPLPQAFLPTSLRAGASEGGMTHSDFDEGRDDDREPIARADEDEANPDMGRRTLMAERNATRRMLDNQAKHAGIEPGSDSYGKAVDEPMGRWERSEDADGKVLLDNATDHSTILLNPRHARDCAAYDVAVGICRLAEEDWTELRQMADWRYVPEDADTYYRLGEYDNTYLPEKYTPAHMLKAAPGIEDQHNDAMLDDPIGALNRQSA